MNKFTYLNTFTQDHIASAQTIKIPMFREDVCSHLFIIVASALAQDIDCFTDSKAAKYRNSCSGPTRRSFCTYYSVASVNGFRAKKGRQRKFTLGIL
jgi:hypothetical protein